MTTKTVIFVRHAKSDWSDYQQRDHARGLNARGKRDGPRMAAHLKTRVPTIDGILSSDAKRARKTARYFAEGYGLPKGRFLKTNDLYHAEPNAIERAIWTLPDAWHTVLVVGHNPGLTEVANLLRHDGYIDNVPTCGLVGTTLPAEHWTDWLLSQAQRTFFTFPKAL